jgi:hypothetical protein
VPTSASEDVPVSAPASTHDTVPVPDHGTGPTERLQISVTASTPASTNDAIPVPDRGTGPIERLQISVTEDAPASTHDAAPVPDHGTGPTERLQISVTAATPASTHDAVPIPEHATGPTERLQISVTAATDRGPWSAPPDFELPPPASATDARIAFTLDPDLLEEFRRAIAVLRGMYGDAQPVWWCLECLLLHVRLGWAPEDADFRRRTAQIEILERDGFECSSPVCTARRELTVHHIVFRSAGGDDEPENLVTLCAACHLHGVHDRGSVRVQRTRSGELDWTLGGVRYEGGRRR